MFKRLPFLILVTLLLVSAGWTFGVRANIGAEPDSPPAAQSRAQAAGDIDQAILHACRWRSIGLHRRGCTIDVSLDNGQPRYGYVGAVGGGLRKATDHVTNEA